MHEKRFRGKLKAGEGENLLHTLKKKPKGVVAVKENLTQERGRKLQDVLSDVYEDLNVDAPLVAFEAHRVTQSLAERYNLETTDYMVVQLDCEMGLAYTIVDEDLEVKEVNGSVLHYVDGFEDSGDGLVAAGNRLNNLDVDTVNLG